MAIPTCNESKNEMLYRFLKLIAVNELSAVKGAHFKLFIA
jgi:hypothetical protein